MIHTIGLIEYTSIAQGYVAVDVLIKKAPVDVLRAERVSSGKYFILFTGDEASVEESLDAAKTVVSDTLIDALFLPNVHPEVIRSIEGYKQPAPTNAVGIIETETIATCVEASDIAVKTSDVHIVEQHLAQGIGGKGYFTITGELSDIEAAVATSTQFASSKNTLITAEIIANPHDSWPNAVMKLQQPE